MTSLCQVAIASAISTIYHPLAYAKTLIQIGYEPLPPYLTTTLFGNPVYMYPNALKYVGHIYRTDGFLGLYRGLGCRLVGSAVNTTVANTVQANLSGKPLLMAESCDELDGDSEKDEVMKLIRDTALETLSRCAGVVCSHPFQVIFIRSMAQFVGRENRFTSFFDAVPDIWRNEGILGFFSGLMPRLLGEMFTIWIANILTYAFNAFVVNVNQQPVDTFKYHTSLIAQLIASQITYPFTLVSVVMCVNNSGLAAGSAPITARYSSWVDCWDHLTNKRQIKRGSSLFWRKYYGAQIITTGGIMMPPLDIN